MGVLSVVDHHEGGVDTTLLNLLIINSQLVGVLDEATTESLHICGERESTTATETFPSTGRVGNLRWHGQRSIAQHVPAKVQSEVSFWH